MHEERRSGLEIKPEPGKRMLGEIALLRSKTERGLREVTQRTNKIEKNITPNRKWYRKLFSWVRLEQSPLTETCTFILIRL